MGRGGSSSGQRKTRAFAQVKRMVNPNDMRLCVLLLSLASSPSSPHQLSPAHSPLNLSTLQESQPGKGQEGRGG